MKPKRTWSARGKKTTMLDKSYCSPGLLEELKEECLKILNESPERADVFFELGNAYLNLGELDQAIMSYKKALRLEQENRKYRVSLGKALVVKAREMVRSAEEELYGAPEAVREKHMEDLSKAIQAAKKLFSRVLEKVNYPDVHKHMGDALALEEKFVEAMEEYDQALEKSPNYLEAQFFKGKLFETSGMIDEAVVCYREVIEKSLGFGLKKRDIGLTHYSLGLLYGERGLLKESIEHYKKMVELHPDYADARYHLGAALFKAGRVKEAAEELKRAIELNPKYGDAQRLYWTCLRDLG